MRQPQQENVAWRFAPDQFDCELPEDLRRRFGTPKRARILIRPPNPPQKRSWPDSVRQSVPAILGIGALVFVVALIGLGSWLSRDQHGQPATQESIARQREVETQAARALDALKNPAPAPAPQSTPAPRAQLVKLPPPRAQLVSLPEWKVFSRFHGTHRGEFFGVPATGKQITIKIMVELMEHALKHGRRSVERAKGERDYSNARSN
jgi:hypothetical protein